MSDPTKDFMNDFMNDFMQPTAPNPIGIKYTTKPASKWQSLLYQVGLKHGVSVDINRKHTAITLTCYHFNRASGQLEKTEVDITSVAKDENLPLAYEALKILSITDAAQRKELRDKIITNMLTRRDVEKMALKYSYTRQKRSALPRFTF